MLIKLVKKVYYQQHIVNIMGKRIYLTETQFKNVLLEELSIADKVIKISKEILNTVLIKSEKSKGFNFKISSGLEIDVKIYSFSNNKEFSNWIENGGVKHLYSGFSYNENKIYLTAIEINGELDVSTIENTIFHEVEHYFQSTKKRSTLYVSGYDKIIDGMKNFNPIISTTCKILYYTKKSEIDAIINGFYSDIENFDLGRDSFKTIFEKTEIFKILNNFEEWEKGVTQWTQTPLFNSARKYLYETGIIKDITILKIKKILLNKLKKSKKYILTKISKVYALHKKRHDNNIIETKITNVFDAMMYSRIGKNQPIKMSDEESLFNF